MLLSQWPWACCVLGLSTWLLADHILVSALSPASNFLQPPKSNHVWKITSLCFGLAPLSLSHSLSLTLSPMNSWPWFFICILDNNYGSDNDGDENGDENAADDNDDNGNDDNGVGASDPAKKNHIRRNYFRMIGRYESGRNARSKVQSDKIRTVVNYKCN